MKRLKSDQGAAALRRSRAAVWLVGAAAAGALAFSVPASAQVTVTMAQGIDPVVLDPALDTLISTRSIMVNIFDQLTWRTADGEVVPALAETWEFIDPKTLKLNLRKGVKFHNGDPFTADDVIFSAERYTSKEKPTPLGAYLTNMFTKIDKVDDHTIIMHLPEPSATIFGEFNRMPIIPKKAFTAMGEREFGNKPVGTGPFKVARWDRNEQLVLEAVADHWRGRASIDRYVIKPIPEDFARFAALRTGAVDIIANLPPERIDDVTKAPNLKVSRIPSGRAIHIGLPLNQKPFDNLKVREAVNHAVNVQEIIDTILGGFADATGTVCQRVLFGFNPNLKPFGYDPEKAKKLLAEAGYPNGFEVKLLGPTGRYTKDREVQDAIGGHLAQVGIKVTFVTPEWADFLDQMYGRGKYKEPFDGMYMLGTGGETLDCDRTLLQRIFSKSRLRYYINENTPKIDQMFLEQRTILDPEKRKQKLFEIQEIVRKDVPWIFLYDQQDIYGLTQRVEWTPRVDEFVWAYDIKVKK
jgi:peptide/nickel transport system substrate-binding protein